MTPEEAEQQRVEDIKQLDRALVLLSEHFDTVQVFCTRHRDDDVGTFSMQKGSGNWYARYGQVCEWITKHDEDARREARDWKPDEPFDDRGF